jgi:hypothetical protein
MGVAAVVIDVLDSLDPKSPTVSGSKLKELAAAVRIGREMIAYANCLERGR